MNLKRILSITLASLTVLSAAIGTTACRKKENEPPKERRTNVYAATELGDLPKGVEYIRQFKAVGDKIYMTYEKTETVTYNENGEEIARTPGYLDSTWDEETGFMRGSELPEGCYYEYEYGNFIALMPIDGGETTEYPVRLTEDGAYYNAFDITSDGTLVCVVQNSFYDEMTDMYTETNDLYFYDIEKSEVKTKISVDDMKAKADIGEDYFYVNGVAAAEDGKIYVSSENVIFVLDANGTYQTNVKIPNGWINRITPFGGRVLVYAHGDNGSKTYYLENGTLNSDSSDSLAKTMETYYNSIGAVGSKLYFSDGRQVVAYDMETEATEVVIDYINSDIDYTTLDRITPLPDGRFIAFFRDWDTETYESRYDVQLFEKVPDEMLGEEIIVRLGCTYSDYNLAKTIINFNKQNTGVRVAVVSYEQYNNEENEWNGAVTQFNNDIVTGSAPDLILLNIEMPVESYFRKGIFADLAPYIDDEENGLNRADYFENILKATEVDGKQYSIIATYSLNTLVAKSKFVGEEPGWTFDEMMQTLRTMPDGMKAFYSYSRDEIINNMFYYGINSLVDWKSGDTKFDSPAFIEFIKYLSTCDEKGIWERYYGENYDYENYDPDLEREIQENSALQYIRDKSLFYFGYISSFTDLMYTRRSFGSADITPIGYPTENGNGAVIVPSQEFAITAKSKVKDQAWTVLKTLLAGDGVENWNLSINKAKMEEACKNASDNWWYNEDGDSPILYATEEAVLSSSVPVMDVAEVEMETVEPVAEVEVKPEVTEEIDAAADIAIEEPIIPYEPYDPYEWYRESGYSEEYIEYMRGNNVPFDQSTADLTLELIKGATQVARQDKGLTDSVKEELSGFFGGVKSAEETAKVIASRAKIYIATNS